MDRRCATGIFESLSSGIRLDVYRLLVKQGPAGMVAGQIASALDLPPANLSFHLRDMVQSGLLTVNQEGRYLRYRADPAMMVDLITYLSSECCGGHPEQCAPSPVAAQRSRPRTVDRPVATPALSRVLPARKAGR